MWVNMAAAIVKTCVLCSETLGKKNYRHSKYIREVLITTLGSGECIPTDSFVCQACFNKLTKLDRLDKDIESRVDRLKVERAALLNTLKEKY